MNDGPIFSSQEQNAKQDIYNIAGDLILNKSNKLADIECQLTDLYLPMEDYLRQYNSTITASSFDEKLLDVHTNELKRKLDTLETKYPGEFDAEVFEFLIKFFRGDCPVKVFRAAVSKKIRILKKERTKYLQ